VVVGDDRQLGAAHRQLAQTEQRRRGAVADERMNIWGKAQQRCEQVAAFPAVAIIRE
jgi:hypothetical protein